MTADEGDSSPDEVFERMDSDPTAGFGLRDYRTVLEDGEGFDRVETEDHVVYTHRSLPAGAAVIVPKDRHQRRRGHTAVRAVEAVKRVREESEREGSS